MPLFVAVHIDTYPFVMLNFIVVNAVLLLTWQSRSAENPRLFAVLRFARKMLGGVSKVSFVCAI